MLRHENDPGKKLIAIILCAGEGTRIKEFSGKIPKSLIKIESKENITIIGHLVSSLIHLHFDQIGIITGYLGEKIVNYFSNDFKIDESQFDKFKYIDASKNYRKGSLYSFLAIFNHKEILNPHFIYFIFPGDTIFNPDTIQSVINIFKKYPEIVDTYPVVFYRNIEIANLNNYFGSDCLVKPSISIADIKPLKNKPYDLLKDMKIAEIAGNSSKFSVNQIIPIFIFNFKFIAELHDIEKRISATTLREILINLIKKGRKVLAFNLKGNNDFYDIDTIDDLNRLIQKKKNGQ